MRICVIDIGHRFNGGENSPELVRWEIAKAMRKANFDGYTLTHGTGYWKGEQEAQTTVRVYIEPDRGGAILAVAGKIRDALAQECVGFVLQEADIAFV